MENEKFGAKIGSGAFSDVYKIGEEDIIKVLHDSRSLEDAKRELELSKLAIKCGLPTAISYDLTKIDGKNCIKYEFLDGEILRDLLVKNPEKFDEYVKVYADLIKQINSTRARDLSITNARDCAFEKAEFIKTHITTEEYERIKTLLDTIPKSENFIHGDCHIKNIIYYKGELLLIDMDTLSYGDAIFEYAGIYAPYVIFNELNDKQDEFLGIPFDMIPRLMSGVIENNFADLSEEERAENLMKISVVSYMHMLWWLYSFNPNEAWLEIVHKEFSERIKAVDDLILKW